jgi:uncharacterized damage-inducible protein DinB
MQHYGGKEMAASFRTVRKNTIQIAEEIPEDKYSFRASPDTRSVAQLLVHIAGIAGFQTYIHANKVTNMATVPFQDLMKAAAENEATPRTKAAIIALLKSEGEKFASTLEGHHDDFLAERVTMPPGMEPSARSRLEMLLSAKEHEMHHRAQLMTIQRMLGLTPHLTRQMQERMAAMQAGAQQPAGQRTH